MFKITNVKQLGHSIAMFFILALLYAFIFNVMWNEFVFAYWSELIPRLSSTQAFVFGMVAALLQLPSLEGKNKIYMSVLIGGIVLVVSLILALSVHGTIHLNSLPM